MFDHQALVDMAREKGWGVTLTGSGHQQLKSPDGEHIIHTSSTPSDHRTAENLAAQLRRAGLAVPHNGGTPRRAYVRNGAADLIRDHFRSHPGKVFHVHDMELLLKARIPDAAPKTVSSFVYSASLRGELVKVGHGQYKWPSAVERAQPAPAPAEAPAPAPAPAATQAPTFGDSTEADIAALDTALAALGHIEAVVRRHRTVILQLAELRRLLGGGTT